jgi:signal transduction histidine kinase
MLRWFSLFFVLLSCATPRSPAQLYQIALERTQAGDRCAFLDFAAIPERSPEREKAEAQLNNAEEEFQKGLDFFDEALADDAAGRKTSAQAKLEKVSVAFANGLTLAPMRPRILLQIGDAYFAAENYERAAYFYRRYALFTQENKQELDEFCQEEQAPSLTEELVTTLSPEETPWWPFYVGGFFSLMALGLAIIYLKDRRKGITLEEFSQKVPEAGPEIAREISCIRHELIKHRLGLAPALVKADETEGAREFVLARLGGDLEGDFARHIESLQRIASGRLEDPDEDPLLRPLAQAVRRAAKMSRKFSSAWSTPVARDATNVGSGVGWRRWIQPSNTGDTKKAQRELETVRSDLLVADRALARLVSALGQTTLDASFLRDAVAGVRQEPRVQSLPLDAINYAEIAPAPLVSIPRVDLSIVVKNVVRNALIALGNSTEKKLLSLEVSLELEPTGEESVLLKIKDSAKKIPENIEHAPAGRGLWIVQKTLQRYDGAISIEVEPEGSQFCKAIVVRLFRAM